MSAVPSSGYGGVAFRFIEGGGPSGHAADLASNDVAIVRGAVWAEEGWPGDQRHRMEDFIDQCQTNGMTPFISISIKDADTHMTALKDAAKWVTDQGLDCGILNEPNSNHFDGDYERAAEVWDEVRDHLGSISGRLIGPQLAGDGASWLNAWLGALTEAPPDVISFHFYNPADNIVSWTNSLRHIVSGHYNPMPDLWITEHGTAQEENDQGVRRAHLRRTLQNIALHTSDLGVRAIFPFATWDIPDDDHRIDPGTLGLVYSLEYPIGCGKPCHDLDDSAEANDGCINCVNGICTDQL